MKHRLRKLTSVVLAVIMVFSVLTIAPFTVSAASFVPRTTAPDTNNAYYYNSAYNPFSRGQCTWYVWGRAFEITGIRPKYSTYPCDGKDVFYNCKSAGYSTGSVPKVGAIACWGASNSTWGYGHVAIVEKIIDGTVYVSEYNRVGSLKFSYNAIPNLPNFIGYVYLGEYSKNISLWGIENNQEISCPTKLWAKRFDNDNNHYAIFYIDDKPITGHIQSDDSGYFSVNINPHDYSQGLHTFKVYYANSYNSDIDIINIFIIYNNTIGDIDNNGTISIDDVTLIQKYIANMSEFDSEQLKAADVTGDNDISIDDVTAIQKYLAGMITTFANA